MAIFSAEAMVSEIERLATAYPYVRLNREKIADLAPLMHSRLGASSGPSFWNPRHFPNESPPRNDQETLQFLLTLDAVMFTIWRRTHAGGVEAWDITIDGQTYIGARGLAAAAMRAIRSGPNLLDTSVLARLSLADVENIFRDETSGKVTLQMLPERQQSLNEVGRVLQERFDRQAINLFRAARGYLFREDEQGLVQQLARHFQCAFADWPLMKHAFWLATMAETRLSFDLPTVDEYRDLAVIRDREHFRGMADYYVPLFYARVGIFEISEQFRQRLADRQEIPRDSALEKSFRANHLIAMRELAESMGDTALIAAIDYESWRNGYLGCRPCRPGVSDEDVPCVYRKSCVAFQSRPDMMKIAWPLVLTTLY